MTTEQPQQAEEPEFVGAIHLRYPQQGALPGIFRHFEWASGDTRVTGDVSRGDAGLAITRAEINAAAPGGITHAVLRSVPLGEVLKAARAELAQEHEVPTHAPRYKLPPGRVIVTDELLRDVALAYMEETAPGKDRQATRRLAERFGRPEGTVRTWVARARKAGWLAPGASGRMSASPGPKLLQWLSDNTGHFVEDLPDPPALITVEGVSYDARVLALLSTNPDSQFKAAMDKLDISPTDKVRLATLALGTVAGKFAEQIAEELPEGTEVDKEALAHELLRRFGLQYAERAGFPKD